MPANQAQHLRGFIRGQGPLLHACVPGRLSHPT